MWLIYVVGVAISHSKRVEMGLKGIEIVNCTVRFTLKLFLQELKCQVTSYSMSEVLTPASSLSKYTLFVFPFQTLNVLRWV